MHQDSEHPEEDVQEILELGLKGVKLHPDFQRFNIDDPKALPMYDCIAGRLPLLIHMGDDRYDWSHPARLARVLEPGFVFTCEPGIYFIPDLIDQWRAAGKFTEFICYDKLEAWKDFGGMRNEEDYLVTAEGHRHLGEDKPCEAEQILAAKG